MSKKETLQNLKKYKNFLESLSPDLSEDERRKRQEKIDALDSPSFNPNNNNSLLNDDLS